MRGIGDDGAVLFLPEGPYVFAQDALVERTHFDFALQRPFDVGKKAVYVNVSDVLAMGSTPLYFLVTIGVPSEIGAGVIEELYRGMRRAGSEFGVSLVGGDTTEAHGTLFIDVSMVGRLPYIGISGEKQGPHPGPHRRHRLAGGSGVRPLPSQRESPWKAQQVHETLREPEAALRGMEGPYRCGAP